MTITFGPVGMLLLGMVLGFVLLFYVLLAVAEWNEVVSDYYYNFAGDYPWQFVRRRRNFIVWPVSYAVLRLHLHLVGWRPRKQRNGVSMRVTGEVKQANDDTETGAGQQLGEDAGGEGQQGGGARETPAPQRRATGVSSRRSGGASARRGQGAGSEGGRQGSKNTQPGRGVASKGRSPRRQAGHAGAAGSENEG